MHRPPLHPVRSDTASALALRATIATTRARLSAVLQARERARGEATSWVGPHRDRHREDTADLLRAGHALDRVLAGLQAALDAEIEASVP